jgi:hypothetical protein
LDHGSIIKVFRVVEEAELVMFNQEKRPCSYVVIELLYSINLDNRITVMGSFSEEICRYYFWKLL